MQLKKPGACRASLAAATLGLLGAPAAQAAPLEDADRPWIFDSAVLAYSETGGRVQAIEPVLDLSKDFGDLHVFSARLVFDSLSGASPNGAAPASTPQTFSRPSGGSGGYTTRANQTPLDPSFKDQRVALSGGYEFPFGDASRFGFGLSGSKEHDFTSAGGNLRYSVDFNEHDTTLSAGLNVEADRINPIGGAPTPFAAMAPAGGGDDEGGEGGGDDEGGEGEGGGGGAAKSKTVADLVLGVTQVLDPRSLVQFNAALSRSSGYQNDPYKILSVVGSDGEPIDYVYESRPSQRTKASLFARYKRFLFERDVADVSYRFMRDDWGIQSHTVDASYRWNFAAHDYVEPHLRWYTQTAADFYHPAIYDGQQDTLQDASADPRLGAFDAWTAGFQYGHVFAGGNEISARLEAYRQFGKDAGIPPQAAAGLAKFDLKPDLTALMFTLGYRFKW